MTNRIEAPEPKVGQVWKSNDKRDLGFHRTVVAVTENYVTLDGYPRTRVRKDRMRPTANGYQLVRDAP